MIAQRSGTTSFGRMLRATFLWRCPACGQGALFTGFFAMRPTCESCAARFERGRGEWTGPVVISYTLGAGLAFLAWLVLFAQDRLFPGAEPLIFVFAAVTALGSYRFTKAWWIWLIHEFGLVYPDGKR